MPNWRRAHVPGGTFYFTVVTDRRAPLFRIPAARALLGSVMRRCRTRWPFEMRAVVLLPEHLHAIWSLPRGDTDYSRRWAWIKAEFTRHWLSLGGIEQPTTVGRQRDGRRGVWQPKFWEHTIETVDDFEKHFDYIHFNPVKHGLVRSPCEWSWSSFHRYVRLGVYAGQWGGETEQVTRQNFRTIEHTVGE